MSLIVVPDACVLIPASLRDIIFRLSIADMCSLRLTDDIIEEVRRNLVRKILVPEDKAQRLVDTIRTKFDHCFVIPDMHLINSMPVNEKDKHVLAAAVCSKANIIVTQNLKDFPVENLAYYQVISQLPDDFLVNMFHSNKECISNILVEQSCHLRNPSMTVLELLNHLQLHAPDFATLAREEFIQQYKKD